MFRQNGEKPRLWRAIKAISQQTKNRSSGESQESTDHVEATIRTLIPSTNCQLTSIQVPQTKRNETRVVAQHGALDMPERRYPENTERFVNIIANMVPRNG